MISKTSSVVYYSLVFILGFTLVLTLLSWLNWPFVAGIVFGTCVLLQIMYLSKKVHETLKKAKEKNISLNISSAFNLIEGKTESEA